MFKRKKKPCKCQTIDVTAPKSNPWVKLTRVYGGQTEGDTIHTQPVMVRLDNIEHVRPRNSIGTKETGNRCTLQMKSGTLINVKEKFSEIKRLLNIA